jgi:uncharacterized membrane protein YagU involved in acid resistance
MAMTATGEQLQRLLPRRQRYPLPPREITQRAFDAAGVHASDTKIATTAMAAHFVYGALAGGLYPLLTRMRSPVVGGAYGVAVWVVSYLGWIPAVRLLAPATQHPLKRNLLMIAVHSVWGATLSSGLKKIEQTETAFRGRRTPDAPGGF